MSRPQAALDGVAELQRLALLAEGLHGLRTGLERFAEQAANLMAEGGWDESEHPRDDSGKFGKGGGASGSAQAGDNTGGGSGEAREEPRQKEGSVGLPAFDEKALEDIAQIIDEDEHNVYGLRVLQDTPEGEEAEAPEIGDVLGPSYVWDDDKSTGDQLQGTSAIGVKKDSIGKAVGIVKGYWGRYIVLLGSAFADQGQDRGEQVMHKPQVLAAYDRGERWWEK